MKLAGLILIALAAGIAWSGAANAETATDKVVETFMELDQDQSAGVSEDEYMAMVRARAHARFQRMDANQDGEVSEEEFRSFWRNEKARWYRLSR